MAKWKIKVAITGGIGSGKSTVAGIFEKKGYKIIKADDVSKDILANDPAVKEKIKKAFGEETYINGSPNKKYIAEKVFNDKEKLKKINAILHPPTIAKVDQEMDKTLKTDDIVFCEAALIFEAKMDELFDHIILVASDDSDKIKRVAKRDNSNPDHVQKRLENQVPDTKKRDKADFVIENDSTLENLKTKSEFILMLIEKMIEK